MYIFAFGLASPRVDMFLFSQGPQNMLSGTERFSFFFLGWTMARRFFQSWRQLQVGLATSTFAR